MGERESPREHIERIRRERFYVGRDEKNPLAEDIHQAVTYLSEELYAKDVHFLMELIQNAEDNEYPPDHVPSLEFIFTSEDITATGATSTLLVFNNEKGFLPANIDSICRIGKSTKKGKRQRGYIGEKGIGFKSVFLVSSQPHIFSGGYKIKFNEKPQIECHIGYIVPEWVEQNPSLHDIQQIYGSSKSLPTTIIVLPLKCEKVASVKNQLSSLHPEILLFLAKIKKMSVRENDDSNGPNTVKAVSISSESECQTHKNMDAESYTLHLACEESDTNKEACMYHMWKQRFPVSSNSRVEKRMEVEEWAITLAFPFGERTNRGLTSPGIYAFLPTQMQTGFPFIIQADFILASSRETILLDNKWNKGILDCVVPAFVNAFKLLVKSKVSALISTVATMFNFIPTVPSTVPLLEQVRMSIREKLMREHIMPCESYTDQRIFCKPQEVRMLLPAFWDILYNARKMGVCLQNISDHGSFILNSVFDVESHNDVLKFLEIGYVDKDWYARCIESSKLVTGISETLYLDLLHFVAENWDVLFKNSGLRDISLLKIVDASGKICLWSIKEAFESSGQILLAQSSDEQKISWLIDWNKEFQCAGNLFFVPKNTQLALNSHSNAFKISTWLKQHCSVTNVDIYGYGKLLMEAVKNSRKMLVLYAHFLHISHSKKHIEEFYVERLCKSLPLVDSYGHVITQKEAVLVPAKCSKWVGLMGSNPWKAEGYIELGADYLHAGHFAGNYAPEDSLLDFLRSYVSASDIPKVIPPNASFPTVCSLLTKENTFLLLDWIQRLKYRGNDIPDKFLKCVKTGHWLRTSAGAKSPEKSFLSASDWGNLLQLSSIRVDIPLIDHAFYGDGIATYKEELKALGVMSEFREACVFIGKHLMQKAADSVLTISDVFSILKFIRFLSEKFLPPDDFVKSIQKRTWLKTSHGCRSPVGAILYDTKWESASSISNLPFIDTEFYGEDILNYRRELDLLGVTVGFDRMYDLVIGDLSLSKSVWATTSDTVIFVLECVRHASSSEKLLSELNELKWLKTDRGLKYPKETVLFDPDLKCLLEAVDCVPVIKEEFYGNRIRSFEVELKKVGVKIERHEVSKVAAIQLQKLMSSSALKIEKVFKLLDFQRNMMKQKKNLQVDLLKCIQNEKWLKTRAGYRSPEDSILHDSDWNLVSSLATLPFIDHSAECYGKKIYDYKDELKKLGVVVVYEKGRKFIASGLNIPHNQTEISPPSVLSLLKCVNCLKKENPKFVDAKLLEKMRRILLKTTLGLKTPNECILFDSEWSSHLKEEDAPFISEHSYGSELPACIDVLRDIGVETDVASGGKLVADNLKCHSDISVISRIYAYLEHCGWKKPEKKAANWIWIPNGSNTGQWVDPESCTIHDECDFFTSKFHVLEKYYEEELHPFFRGILGVKSNPGAKDYCELWKEWESTEKQLSEPECCSFWVAFAKKCSRTDKELLLPNISKVPVRSETGILLLDKEYVFIPDDLLLADLIGKACDVPLFVWHPEPTHPYLPVSKLYDIFSTIGVKVVSKAVEKDELIVSDVTHSMRKGIVHDKVLKVGMFRIILGFLADPSLGMSIEKRHQVVKNLFDVDVLETEEPIMIRYNVRISSKEVKNVAANRIFHWDRERSKFFVQNLDLMASNKTKLEFATCFAEVISQGMLWEATDHISSLAELIKVGWLLDFDADAVDYLLKFRNLRLFSEDERLLTSFSSGNGKEVNKLNRLKRKVFSEV